MGRIPPSAYMGEGSTRSYTVCWTHMRSWSSQQQVDSVRWSYVSYMTVHLVATWGLKRPMWLCKNVYGGPEWRPQLSSMLQPALYASASRIGLHMALACCSPWNLLTTRFYSLYHGFLCLVYRSPEGHDGIMTVVWSYHKSMWYWFQSQRNITAP